MLATPTGRPAMLLAAALAAALVPAGLVAGDHNPCDGMDPYTVDETIRASSPLSETVSASQALAMSQENQEVLTLHGTQGNGVDAYVHDIGCEAQNLPYSLEATTGEMADAPAVDVSVQFYDEHFRHMETHDADGATISDQVPDDARYVVVVMEQGPLVSGISYDGYQPNPYSIDFELSFLD